MQQVGVNAVFNVSGFVSGANTYIQMLNAVNVQTSQMVSGIGVQTQGAGKHFDLLGRVISQTLGNAISYITWRVIPDLFRKLTELGTNIIDTGKLFQQQMAVVGTVADDTTIPLEDLSAAAIKVGDDTTVLGADALDAAEALTMLYKGGLSTNEVFGDMNGYLNDTVPLGGAMRAVFDVMAASGIDVAEATDLAVIALSTFGGDLKTEEERANFVVESLDNMVRSANASVTEVHDLGEAWHYVGPAATMAGLSVEDVNNALAIMSNYGLNATTAGTSLNGMLTDLVETTSKSQAELDRLGIETFNPLTKTMYPLVDIVGQFEVALEGASDQERITALGKIFDIRGARAMNALLQEGVEGWNDMSEATYNASGMQEQAIARMNTLAGSSEILDSVITTLKIKIEEYIDDGLKNLIDATIELVEENGPKIFGFFEDVGDIFNGLVLLFSGNEDFMKSVTDAFTAIAEGNFVDAFLNIQDIFTQVFGEGERTDWLAGLVPILSKITDVGPQLADGFSAITSGDLLGGIGSIGDSLSEAFGDDRISKVTDAILSIVDTVMKLSGGDVTGAIDSFKGFIGGIFGEDVADKVTGIIDTIIKFKDEILGVLAGLGTTMAVSGIVTMLTPIVAGILALATPVTAIALVIGGVVAAVVANWDKIVAAFTSAKDWITNALALITSAITSFTDGSKEKATGLLATLKPIFDFISKAVMAAVDTISQQALPSLKKAFDTLKATFTSIWSSIGPIFESVKGAITAIFVALEDMGVIDFIIKELQDFGTFIGGLILLIWTAVISIITGISKSIEFLANTFAIFAEAVGQIITGVIGYVTGLWTMIQQIFSGDIPGALKTAGDNFSYLLDIISGTVMAIWASISVVFGTILTFIAGFITGIIEYFRNLYTELVGASIIPDMVNGIITWFLTLVDTVITVVTGFVADVIAWFLTLTTDVIAHITTLVTTVITKLTTLATEGLTFAKNFVNNVIGEVKELPKKVLDYITQIITDVEAKYEDFKGIGKNLMLSMRDGVVGAVNALMGAIQNAINDAIKWAEHLLGIGSPSKVFMEIGHNVSVGLANGITASTDPIQAVNKMVSGMTHTVSPATAQNTMNNYNYTTVEVNPTYRNYQSEAGVYYDVVAALGAVRN